MPLENGPAGGTYHGVAKEGIPFRDIAGLIGRRLNLSVLRKSPAEAAKHFSFLAPFIPMDNLASGKITQERLGWKPTQPGLLAGLNQADYFKALKNPFWSSAKCISAKESQSEEEFAGDREIFTKDSPRINKFQQLLSLRFIVLSS